MSRLNSQKTPLYAEILLPQKVGMGKETLTYSLPADINFSIGQLVEVPLRSHKAKGIVLDLHNTPPPFKTREIIQIVQNAPHLSAWQVEILKHISSYYFCPLFKSLKLFLPSSIITRKKALPDLPSDDDDQPIINHPINTLSEDQEKALAKFQENTKAVSLLHGITGSGKTEIYLRLAEMQLKQLHQVLVLVPEISLTPQTMHRFEARFGNHIALIHSKLTAKEKKEQWLKIYKKEAKVIIGSRSALFAPFQDLGLIIIDEEHEPSFKQDQSPRYNTLDIAKKMAELLNIKILIGSATPSLESYYAAENEDYQLLEMPRRIQFNAGTDLPSGHVIDLREELRKGNFSIFSETLLEKIDQKLSRHEQIILFINRRGAASAVICRECGMVIKCKKCEVAMTYHKKLSVEDGIYDAERLICHHCGLIDKIPVNCPNCHSHYIKYIGLGTQRVEDEIKKLFPLARVIRADSDTVQKKDDFKNIYNNFKNHQADILIGTQMIGKGLHLPRVNLVGIMLADMGLTIPDFRSSERTFQLLTQVAGRAGREGRDGEVIIQTYMPDNYAITCSAGHDFKKFYRQEIDIRKKMGYPPFGKLIKLTVKNANATKCRNTAESIYNQLIESKSKLSGQQPSVTFYPALIGKLRGKYRWNILIQGDNPRQLLNTILPLNNVAIDVDPISIN